MVHYWCMRFEGRHGFFKDLAHRVKCFKNVAKTMACLNQEQVCYQMTSTSSRSIYHKETKVGISKLYRRYL